MRLNRSNLFDSLSTGEDGFGLILAPLIFNASVDVTKEMPAEAVSEMIEPA